MTTNGRVAWLARLATEFGVIVVGVLVALLAESWWQERGERAAEMETLHRISLELSGDSLLLEFRGFWFTMVEPSFQVAREVLEGRESLGAPASLAMSYAAATEFSEARPVGTWEALEASGGLADVTDPDLRRALVGFYGQFDGLEADGSELPREYRSAVTALIPSSITYRILQGCIRDETANPTLRRPRVDVEEALRGCDAVGEAEARSLLEALRRHPDLREALEARAYEVAVLRDRHRTTVAAFDTLRVHLERVLAR